MIICKIYVGLHLHIKSHYHWVHGESLQLLDKHQVLVKAIFMRNYGVNKMEGFQIKNGWNFWNYWSYQLTLIMSNCGQDQVVAAQIFNTVCQHQTPDSAAHNPWLLKTFFVNMSQVFLHNIILSINITMFPYILCFFFYRKRQVPKSFMQYIYIYIYTQAPHTQR